MITVRFNFHSCFTVELDSHIFIFDYYKSADKKDCLKKLDNNKQTIFFASHRHGDHFSKDIFEYRSYFKDVRYVLSDDIWMKNSEEEIDFVKPNSSYKFGDVEVVTLKSTDEGVAFLIKTEGKCVYHAGDLHWWYWEENGAEYVRTWGEKYIKEIEKIKNEDIDVAFVLLDPRMKSGYGEGMSEFLKRVPKAKNVFPMHMWGAYSLINDYLKTNEGKVYKDKLFVISEENEEFIIE